MSRDAAHAAAREKAQESMRSISKTGNIGKENVCYNGDSK
jgi:hypothetical protein